MADEEDTHSRRPSPPQQLSINGGKGRIFR
jgi:hypothetical protein